MISFSLGQCVYLFEKSNKAEIKLEELGTFFSTFLSTVRFVFCMLYGPTTLEFTRGPGYELSGYVATTDRHFCFWNLQRAVQQNFAQ